jgi:hypothetical protein
VHRFARLLHLFARAVLWERPDVLAVRRWPVQQRGVFDGLLRLRGGHLRGRRGKLLHKLRRGHLPSKRRGKLLHSLCSRARLGRVRGDGVIDVPCVRSGYRVLCRRGGLSELRSRYISEQFCTERMLNVQCRNVLGHHRFDGVIRLRRLRHGYIFGRELGAKLQRLSRRHVPANDWTNAMCVMFCRFLH